ncbi:hypothetical protein [Bilophila wadsworthia]|uniref:hypothetical protein n=1 Tax=Bilophila wadsworthia TaxID=35833 RepID=UPI003522BB03
MPTRQPRSPIIEKQHQHTTNHPSPSALRDLMGSVPLKDAARATMSVADALQHSPLKGARLMGLTCAFLMAAESAGLPVPDLMGMARNCMNDGEGRRPEFRAVDDFINNEIL